MRDAAFLAGLDGQRFTARKGNDEMKIQKKAFEFILQRLKETGLTLDEIARQSEISISTLKAMRNSSTESLRLTTVISLSRMLGIDWVQISQASEAILKPQVEIKINHMRKKRASACRIHEEELEYTLIYSFINERIRELVSKRKYTVAEIASRASVSPSYINLIMNKKRIGSLYTFFKLISALDSDLVDLDRHKAICLRLIHSR